MSDTKDGQIISVCENCGERVVDGPKGGYCCSRCGYSVDPPELVRARRQADWDRRAAARKGSWPELRRIIRKPVK